MTEVIEEGIPGAKSSLPEHLSRWGIDLRIRHVVVTELILLVLLQVVPWPGWPAAAGIAVAIAIVAVLSYKGATAAGWIARAARFLWFRHNSGAAEHRAAIPAADDADLPGIGAVGVRWDGEHVVTAIALYGRPYTPTVLAPEGAKTSDMVPLEEIAALLRQVGGLELAAVDVVSVGSRVSGAQYSATYDEIIADRPAVALRETFLVLRLCPLECLDAMAYRETVPAAAAAATERIRQAVARTGCRATALTAAELDDVTSQLGGGLVDERGSLDAVEENWDHVRGPGGFVHCYRVSGKELSSDFVNSVWEIQSRLTVLTVRIEQSGAGEVLVSALVRFHSESPWTNPPQLNMLPVHGQAFDAVAASLPLGTRALRVQLSRRPLHGSELEVPLGPSGFMMGTLRTQGGYPFLLSWSDPLKATRISVKAELDVLEPWILRATAAGARVLVYTDRPQAWQPIARDYIQIGQLGGPVQVPPTMLVLDLSAGTDNVNTSARAGQTVVTVSSDVVADADIVIKQLAADELVLSTRRLPDVPLRPHRPRNESQYLDHLRARHSAEVAAAPHG
ncbi:type VII secretion protein EccE [Mycobacteroides abscessus subsp. massiliense]|uniref:type VII secretion protein EccE n=1 Tax=Mycobacteroides abscessus TaxID=36809 RepID=UPI0009A6CCF6|nr:type VII secretion protein EccE [Mycobacteroides abscessus]SKL15926.1 type VII secretion protein EccE [Mycobacteroides abscessus subsp. massiliense]SKL93871.1 type VII secretion protein EccE [Mycobacteroides abscessus subsp. massiliense]SKM75432.1 type VII secretion protein EccE [Mycobacteroides abscessus subsp. massiliense]